MTLVSLASAQTNAYASPPSVYGTNGASGMNGANGVNAAQDTLASSVAYMASVPTPTTDVLPTLVAPAADTLPTTTTCTLESAATNTDVAGVYTQNLPKETTTPRRRKCRRNRKAHY